jgi:hypothetical protein
LVEGRQPDYHCRTSSDFALQLNVTFVLLDYAVADRKSETGPLLLQSEEGIEDFVQMFTRNSGARISDPNFHHLTPRRFASPSTNRSSETPTLGHRLKGVQKDVQEDLFELCHVGVDLDFATPPREEDFDTLFPGLRSDQQESVVDKLQEVNLRRVEISRASQGQQIIDDSINPVHLGKKLVQKTLFLVGFVECRQHILNSRPDGGQGVANLVRDSCRKLAGGGQSLGPVEAAETIALLPMERRVFKGQACLTR